MADNPQGELAGSSGRGKLPSRAGKDAAREASKNASSGSANLTNASSVVE